ncbi:MAG: hypothetical protein ACO27R_03985 [Hylemonella sp.]
MSISKLHVNTLKQHPPSSTLMRPIVPPHLMRVSPSTATNASWPIASGNCSTPCKSLSDIITRTRHLIIDEGTGLFLATLEKGKPLWVSNPCLALQHCHFGTVLHNLCMLREFFNVPESLGVRQLVFYAYKSDPTQWMTNDSIQA